MKIDTLIPRYCKHIDDVLEPGVIYISREYKTAIHLCACGCGGKCVTPFNRDDKSWTITDEEGLITLRPSCGNWSGEKPYHAHYFVTRGKIEWC